MSLLNPGKPRYGPRLGVVVARPLEAICREVESWNRQKLPSEEDATARGALDDMEAGGKVVGRGKELYSISQLKEVWWKLV